jgi:hypothetical protein
MKFKNGEENQRECESNQCERDHLENTEADVRILW